MVPDNSNQGVAYLARDTSGSVWTDGDIVLNKNVLLYAGREMIDMAPKCQYALYQILRSI